MSATPRAVERARAEHRQAVEAYVASARALAEAVVECSGARGRVVAGRGDAARAAGLPERAE